MSCPVTTPTIIAAILGLVIGALFGSAWETTKNPDDRRKG